MVVVKFEGHSMVGVVGFPNKVDPNTWNKCRRTKIIAAESLPALLSPFGGQPGIRRKYASVGNSSGLRYRQLPEKSVRGRK
jgi:hypothetical protein